MTYRLAARGCFTAAPRCFFVTTRVRLSNPAARPSLPACCGMPMPTVRRRPLVAQPAIPPMPTARWRHLPYRNSMAPVNYLFCRNFCRGRPGRFRSVAPWQTHPPRGCHRVRVAAGGLPAAQGRGCRGDRHSPRLGHGIAQLVNDADDEIRLLSKRASGSLTSRLSSSKRKSEGSDLIAAIR